MQDNQILILYAIYDITLFNFIYPLRLLLNISPTLFNLRMVLK